MVRRQGKRKARASLESGNGEKKREGEGSSTGLGAHGAYDPKRRGEGDQRYRAHAPGLSLSYSSFKFSCVELDE
jgi:hypothetical protein